MQSRRQKWNPDGRQLDAEPSAQSTGIMNPDLARLIQLQELETTAEDARRALADRPARLGALDARLVEAQQVVDDARARLSASQVDRRNLEKEAAAQQARLSKFKDQSGSVKTNKEYQALLHEIDIAKQELDQAEERILGHMEAADGLAANVKDAEATLAATKAQVATERQAIEHELAEVEQELATALREREALVATLEKRLVSMFETLTRGRKGLGVTQATREGLCAACYVRLRPQLFAEVRENQRIIQCENCQRILYWVPATQTEPPANGS